MNVEEATDTIKTERIDLSKKYSASLKTPKNILKSDRKTFIHHDNKANRAYQQT